MNDPHVARLIYRAEHSEAFSYAKAEPLDRPEPEFRVRIDERQVTVEMFEHFATADEARALLDPFLRAWEVDAGLNHGPGVLRFVYEHAEILDRNPTPGTLSASGLAVSVSFGNATAVSGLRRYPEPPAGIAFSSEVDAMFDRYSRYKAGQTTLGDLANFCQTVVESTPGQRSGAEKRYRIHRDVLRMLGELAERKGGRLHSRKWMGWRTDYTDRERLWIEAAVKALIRRAGEVAYDPASARRIITLDDLPQLGS